MHPLRAQNLRLMPINRSMRRHSIGPASPVAMPLQGNPIFLQVNVLLPPWNAQQTQGPQALVLNTLNQGFRR